MTKRLKFEAYLDAALSWRWRMVDGNNRIVGSSGEAFTRKTDAQRAIRNVIADIVGDAGGADAKR